MRVRTALGRALVSVSALVAVVGGLAAPASAGDGPSEACSDSNTMFREVPLVTTPITFAVEVNRTPFDTTQQIQVCYSTTPEGSPGGVGGWIYLRYDYTTAGYLRVTLDCDEDPTPIIGPVNDCGQTQASIDLRPSTGTHVHQCVLNNPLGGACLYYEDVPWVMVHPVIQVTAWGIGPIPLTLPPVCIDLYGTCP